MLKLGGNKMSCPISRIRQLVAYLSKAVTFSNKENDKISIDLVYHFISSLATCVRREPFYYGS